MSFAQAQEDSKKLTEKPSNEDLLKLYALYKVGNGEDFSAAAKPGMFDLKGKAKYNAWKEKVDAGLSKEDAQAEYVKFVEELKISHKFDPTKTAEAVGA